MTQNLSAEELDHYIHQAKVALQFDEFGTENNIHTLSVLTELRAARQRLIDAQTIIDVQAELLRLEASKVAIANEALEQYARFSTSGFAEDGGLIATEALVKMKEVK